MKTITMEGYQVTIGQTKEENEQLFHDKESSHTWFHMENVPSAHLWINESYRNLPKSVIYKCALELKKSGKYRKCNHVRIIYALGEDICSSGHHVGEVITKNYRKINA